MQAVYKNVMLALLDSNPYLSEGSKAALQTASGFADLHSAQASRRFQRGPFAPHPPCTDLSPLLSSFHPRPRSKQQVTVMVISLKDEAASTQRKASIEHWMRELQCSSYQILEVRPPGQ